MMPNGRAASASGSATGARALPCTSPTMQQLKAGAC
jgi:hypothetical protein